MHTPKAGDISVPLCALPDKETVRPKGLTTSDDTTTQVPAPQLPDVPGYELFGVLGRGSMGVVYKARQSGLHRHVALKMILTDTPVSQEKLQRFLTEARVVACLQHPNIVQIFEINLQHAVPYFSMEFIEGGTLADRLGGRPQPFRVAAQFVLTLARTIHVAHQIGIIHRDLKPANILLASADSHIGPLQRLAREMELQPPELCLGTPKITDFGLAKELYADVSRTESGMIMGTPCYMAPEQAEGKSREVGPAADIYALGVILYEMLTGRPPFTAESPLETILLLFQAEPVPPSQLQPKIPRDLETICLKCLCKEPQRRYASAEELANDLHHFLVGEPIRARPASTCEKIGKWIRRRPARAMLAACIPLVVVSLLGLILWNIEKAASERVRLVQLRDKVKDLLHASEGAVTAQDWQKAEVQLTDAGARVVHEPALADLRARIEQLLLQTKQQRLDHERLEKFRERRNEALFHATLFTGTNLAAALQETRAAAIEALSLFGITPSSAGRPVVENSSYPEREKAEIVSACYELLAVLADAEAQPLAGHQVADERRQAQEALHILDRTAALGIMTQAYHRRRAHYLAQAGQVQAAEEERRRAAALRPTTPLDHFLLGQEQYRQGDSKQAIPAFENVLQLQPDHFWAGYYLALCWLQTQHPDQAVTCLTSCLGQRQDFPWLYLLRASAWGELGQFARAEADFATALQKPLPDTARYCLLINRGVLRIRQGRLDSARADLQQAIALRPEQYQGYVNLAQAHLKAQQLDDAIQQLDQAIRCEPGLASLHRTRARVHLLRGDQAAALADVDQTIRLGVDAAPPVLAEDHLERGRLLHRQKEYEKALAAYDDALRVLGRGTPADGRQPEAPARDSPSRGDSPSLPLRPGGRLPVSVPQHARISRLRAETLLELKRLPEALQSLDDCLKSGPPDAGAFKARAALRTQLGHYAGAQADYTRALELEPDAAVYAARGWCSLVADAPRLALPDFEEAIRLAPEQGDAYAGRGYSRVLLGDYRLAVGDAEEALRRGPQASRLYYNVTRIYAQAIACQDSETPRNRWSVNPLRSDWQERAVQALARSLDMLPPGEAAGFWQNVVQSDKALNPIRGNQWFRHLATRYPPQRAGSGLGTAVQPKQ